MDLESPTGRRDRAPEGDHVRILVVDDEEPIRRTLTRLLERYGYECSQAADADEAKAHLEVSSVALVLSDVNMPGESGLDLVMHIADHHPGTATVMVTGEDDPAFANLALETGAYGYIIKPLEPNEVLINVANALRRLRLEIENRNHRERLEQMVRERTAGLWEAVKDLETAQRDLRTSREETIQRLSVAAEFRDDETAKHLERMSRYCALLAEKVGWEVSRCEFLRLASVMHDVGKIGIPDSILLKPAKLDPDEWQVMKKHSEYGYRILSGSEAELLNLAARVALTHHERVDGTGYPQALVEDEIPLEGRIAAVADVFDALTTDRVYRKAFTAAEAFEIMREGRGDQFDSRLFDEFVGARDVVLGIKEQHRDSGYGDTIVAR